MSKENPYIHDPNAKDPDRRASLPGQLRQAAMLETDLRKRNILRDLADELTVAIRYLELDMSLDTMTTVTALFARAWFLYTLRTPLDGGSSGGHMPATQFETPEFERKVA